QRIAQVSPLKERLGWIEHVRWIWQRPRSAIGLSILISMMMMSRRRSPSVRQPFRTKRHWQRLYRDAETRYGSGFIGLIPHFTNSGGTRKVKKEVLNLVEEVLTTHYDTVTRKPKRGAYGEYLKQSEQRNLPSVSQRTFYTLSKRHKPIYEQV